MTWKIKDEFIDVAQGRHVVIFHNPDTGAEHHLINLFGLDACPTCGHTMATFHGHSADFHKLKADKLNELNDHHKKVAAYLEKHPHVARKGQR